MPETTDIASIVQGLSPFARWYLALTAMAALSVFCYQDRATMADWPLVFQLTVWFWFASTVLAPVYIMINGAVVSVLSVAHARWGKRADNGGAQVNPMPPPGQLTSNPPAAAPTAPTPVGITASLPPGNAPPT